MGKAKVITLLIVIALILQAFVPHFKALMLVTEEFPQIPVKPLGLLTLKPSHEQIEIETKNGKVVADIVTPKHTFGPKQKSPAVIIAMGVKTSEQDKPTILHFANTMARLGYTTIWPRLEILDKGVSLNEEPETFVRAFEHLEKTQRVDKNRISLVGFSIGSSIAFVAAAGPRISDKLHSLVFFGGYYDIFDYLESLAKKTMAVDGETAQWQPHEGAINHVTEILKTKKSETILKYIETGRNIELEETEANELKEISPREFVGNFKAPIFILHEKADNYVPYVESFKLRDALPREQVQKFHLANLFEHVQPKSGLSKETIAEFLKLYGFLVEVLRFL